MRSIDNSQDIIDSRDVIKRIEELEADKQALVDAVQEAQEAVDAAQVELDEYNDDTNVLKGTAEHQNAMSALCSAKEDLRTAKCELEDWTGDEEAEIDPSDDAKELKCLKELADNMENECEWESGTGLIRESYFEDYARQTAEDCGLLENCDKWPATCIDWEKAADELKQDYSTVTFKDEDGEGIDYYYRS